MDRESQGGSDVGRDYERDLGDETPAALRDTAPDYLAPIDASAPVSGHSPAPEHATSPADVARAGLVASRVTCSIPRSGRSGRWASRRLDRPRAARRPLGAEPRPAAPRRGTRGPAGRLHDRRRRVRHRRQRRPPAVVGRRAIRRSRTPRCAISRHGRRRRRGPTRFPAIGGSSAPTPGTAGMPPGSCCPRSSPT